MAHERNLKIEVVFPLKAFIYGLQQLDEQAGIEAPVMVSK